MHELHKLKDMLCKELEKYGSKNELTAGTLDVVDKLTHAIKNLDKIIDHDDEGEYSGEYSGRMFPPYYYGENRSYAPRRDARGRYSRDTDIVAQLEDLINDAPDERTKAEMRKFINKMETMR